MKRTIISLMLIAGLSIGTAALAAELSLHEVYQAANSGRIDEAQRMMTDVLQAHPNSAKAHYVEAELLSKQGFNERAQAELTQAEKLSPGLPFAEAQAVSTLKQRLQQPTITRPDSVKAAPIAQADSTIPWGWVFTGIGLIAFIIWASRFMSACNARGTNTNSNSPVPFNEPSTPYQPAYPSGQDNRYAYSPQGYQFGGTNPTPAQGIGSRVINGIATGAAVGAGVVAGEALMHHFLDGNREKNSDIHQNLGAFEDIPSLPGTPSNDFWGTDFGISDNTGWDDVSNDGSDWN